MDDIRSAQERLELAERRLAALQDEGLDTAGLTSQLGFARRALNDGQAAEVLTLCEEILNTAQRLATHGGGQDTRPARPVKSDRFPKATSRTAAPTPPAEPPPEPAKPAISAHDTPSGRLPVAVHHDDVRIDPRIAAAAGFPEIQADSGGGAAATAMPTPQVAMNAAALTEEVRKQVVKTATETQGKTITTSQIREFIVKSVQKALTDHLADHTAEQARIDGRISAALAEQVQPTLTALAERLDRIAAHPSAPPAWDEARLSTLFERLVGPLLSDLEHRLEVRLAPLPPIDPTPAVQAAIRPMQARLDRIDAAIAALPPPAPAMDPAPAIQAALEPVATRLERIDQGLAPLARRLDGLEAERSTLITTMAGLAPLAKRLDGLEEQTRQQQAQVMTAVAQAGRAEQAAQAVRQLDLKEVVSAVVSDALAGLHDELARKLTPPAAAPSASVPPEQLSALKEELARDLRADLDWQVEAMAAEKGWITLGDMKSEVSRHQGGGHGPVANPGFARLEAALVEFVNQTQLQQTKFLELLSREVEQRTSIVRSQALSTAHARRPIQVTAAAGNDADPFLGLGEDAAPSDQHPAPGTGTQATARADQPPAPGPALPGTHRIAPGGPGQDPGLDVLSISSVQRAINDSVETTPAGSSTTKAFTRFDAAAGDQAPAAVELADEHLTTASLEPVTDQAMETDVMTELTPVKDPADPSGRRPAIHRMPIQPLTAEVPAEDADHAAADAGHGSGALSAVFPTAETVSIHAAPTIRTEALASPGSDLHEASTSTAGGTRAHVPLTMRQRVRPEAEPQGFEAALRHLVDDEVRRRVPATVAAAVQAAIDQALAAQEARFRETLDARLAELPPPPAAGDPAAAVTALAEALGRQGGGGPATDLATQLKSPAARQAILAVVATEAVENPSALAELTGLRAFLRREVAHATDAARQQADEPLVHESP